MKEAQRKGLSVNVVKTVGIVLAECKRVVSVRVDPLGVCEERSM